MSIKDDSYQWSYYKLIGIVLSAEANRNIPQQINFTWKLEEDNGVTMFFIVEKQQQIILNFSLALLIVKE